MSVVGNYNVFEVADAFAAIIRKYDFFNTRPITAGMDSGWEDPRGVARSLDIVGVNYHSGEYDVFHNANPTRPMIGSETASLVSDRGLYANDPEKGYLWGYDIEHPAVGWGLNAQARGREWLTASAAASV
jgi:beta-galactosidase